MKRLCLNQRDELIVIPLDKVAYLESDGNYSNVYMIGGVKMTLTFGLGKMEEYITNAFRDTGRSFFVRLGRKYIINQTYLSQISIPRQRLILRDFEGHKYTLVVPKTLLKNYKELMANGFKKAERPSQAIPMADNA